MNFYFDESGSFRVPNARDEHAVGIVVGIVVPETAHDRLWQRFQEFTGGLPASALDKKGEPKGHLLDEACRHSFVMLIAESEEVIVCPILLDLTTLAGRVSELHDRIIKKINLTSKQCKYETMKLEVALLGRQMANLSPPAAFRLCTWAQCIMRSLQDSIIHHSRSIFDDCWNHLTFELDPVQQSPNSREERVFSTMLPGWITAWSHDRPFQLIEEIHTPDHPFVRQWDAPDGIDLGKMLRNNVRFAPSHKCVGIQIADMAASITSVVVAPGIVSTRDLDNYGIMMSRSIRSATHAHGIFSFDELDSNDISRRYFGLVAAVAKARERDFGLIASR